MSSTPRNEHNAEAGPSNENMKRSKQPQLSCAECRRLKLRCDREVPCSNCVRRKCSELCPDGVKETRRQTFDIKAAENLQKRLSTLETLLADHGVDIPSSTENDNNQTIGKRRRDSSSTHSLDHSKSRQNSIGAQNHQHHQSHQYPYSDLQGELSSSPRYRRSPSTSTITSTRPPISSTREHPYPTPRQIDLLPSSSSHESVYWARTDEQSGYSRHHPPPLPPPAPRSVSHPSSPHNSTDMIPGSSMNSIDGSIPPRHLPRSPVAHSHGTLVIGQEGRSRYLGPTAGTEWLKNQELGSPESRKSPSPEIQPVQENLLGRERGNATEHLLAFPFPLPNGPSTMELMCSHLPAKDDAEVLMDSYYRYFAWNHDTAPRKFFQPVFDRIFECISKNTFKSVHPQQLALLFAILAMGTLQNLELPPNDPSADEYLALSKGCLTKGDFLNNNTIAGVQTLIVMAHYLLETEKGRNGDSAWPLWGLAMRIIVAMGLHRDGARWNLPADVVEERRQVFWAAYAIEILQANCFSRPTSLALQYIDTAFPVGPSDHPEGSKSYQTLRFELIQLSARILDTGMSVHFESYDSILGLYSSLCSFERTIPFELRCRTSMLNLPSEYVNQDQVYKLSPELTRKNIKKTFQQFTLALNVSEHVLFLHRPYFVMAMHDKPLDPTISVYGKSYLAVIERCSVIIQIVSTLYEIHPAVSSRQWFLWYHIFTAAVCLGTMVLRNPTSVLSQFAITSIDQSISVYSSLIKHNQTSSISMIQNHDWLIRLRSRAFNKVVAANNAENDKRKASSSGSGNEEGSADQYKKETSGEDRHGDGDKDKENPIVGGTSASSVNGEEDLDIVGWKTRLIESASNGTQIAINISSSNSSDRNENNHKDKGYQEAQSYIHPQQQFHQPIYNPATNTFATPPNYLASDIASSSNNNSNNNGVPSTVQQVLQQHLVGTDDMPIPNTNMGMESSTDLLLHQFWDPMMLNDSNDLGSANWWSWT
ncbi:uncharacterized protein L201_002305 [Kwoniella dendrophila CBS 6074]|uniref:Zn(2)-C6 fungal-type domain-containing protein n=1 Tax=Kwoniella dendrophila CBS 6074 TaxID=1295534 RepID=A0AAX4JPU6_9TREE